MALVFDPGGGPLPDLILADAKRQEIQGKIATIPGIGTRLNPWVCLSFDGPDQHCEAYFLRDGSTDGFSEVRITAGLADFDALVRS